VFFPGSSGTSANGDQTPAAYYFSLGYEIVQIEWANDWEITNAPAADTGNNSSTNYPANIQVAACREATFLNFIFNTSNTTLTVRRALRAGEQRGIGSDRVLPGFLWSGEIIWMRWS